MGLSIFGVKSLGW